MLLRDEKKKSGILCAVSSLPSDYGIGTLGLNSYKFVDFLAETGQKYWQLLPLVPLGDGNSPYKSSSCYAGEILYIDLEFLVRDGLLSISDLPKVDFPSNVNFDLVRQIKIPLIKKAAENFDTDNEDYGIFCRENQDWLNNYALFMTALEVYNTYTLEGLPKRLKFPTAADLDGLRMENGEKIKFYKVSQYFFFAQYFELKRYAEDKGIELIGDLPFYVSLDSADVWANRENFLLDHDLKPKLVAGVPPDCFSETGQLWGNPIYNFEYQKQNGFNWWINRLKHYFKMYDVVRIDHFRAFANYYTIPFDHTDAKNGEWVMSVGNEFWEMAKKEIPDMQIIAEDLGGEIPLVQDLVKETGFPNMKIMQFAFSGDPNNPHLPQNYPENCICYTGTHDNNTTLGFCNNALSYEKEMIDNLYPETEDLPCPLNIITAALKSPAKTVIIPIQDWLMLDESARMNIPGVPNGNWTFRLKNGFITEDLKKRIIRISAYR